VQEGPGSHNTKIPKRGYPATTGLIL